MPRPGLIARLRDATSVPVIAVVAPPGYGKTTILAEWAESDPRPFGWLWINRRHRDPAIVLPCLAAVLASVIPLEPSVFDDLGTAHRPQREVATTKIAASVSRSPHPFVLVLDDLHLLTDQETLTAVQTVIEQLPDGCQLAFAGRREPELGLPRLRSEGRVLDIRTDQLRLRAKQARELMAAAGAEVTGRELTGLLTRTEGWPVGLYFAALSGNPGAFPPSPPGSFEGDDRLLTDYIRTEFLSHAPEDHVRFMIRTSVLDELCGPLCDAVLGQSGSAAILEEIEASNLLLVPLDRQRYWYRFHRLFQRMLRHELEGTEPGSTQELARRASDWCEHDDQLDQAVHYAQMAGDAVRVGEIIVRGGMAQFAIGRAATLREWFDWLATRNCPDSTVAILGAWLNLALGSPDDARRWVNLAAGADGSIMMPDGSPLQAWVLPLRATLAQDVRQMHDDASVALQLTPDGGLWQPTATVILGLAESYLGNPGEADTLLARGAKLGIERGAPAEVIVGFAGRAAIAMSQDRWHDAAAHLSQASSLIDGSGLDSYPVCALVHAAAARVAAYDRDPWTARRELSAAARLLPALNSALAPLAVQARLQYLRACVMLGDTLSAENLMDEVSELLRSGRDFGALSAEAAEVAALIQHAHAASPLLAKLTPAELRLIPLLATQLTSREIATQLSVSVHTVKTQVASIYRKLQVSSRTEAIDQARHQGLLDD